MNTTFRSILIAAGGLAILLFTGCSASTLRPKMAQTVRNPVLQSNSLARFTSTLSRYEKAVETNNLDGAKRDRNIIISLTLADIEDRYREFEGLLFANHAGFQIGADVLELGLATIATVSNGARGKTILSAILSGVTGTRLSIDKNLFRQQTVQALIASMHSNRDRLRIRINTRIVADGVDLYPYEAAKADLIELFFAGTLQGALQQLHQTASAAAQQKEEELEIVLMANVTKNDMQAARDLRALLPGLMKTDDGKKKLRGLLSELGVAAAASMTDEELDGALREELQKAGGAKPRKILIEAAKKLELIK